MSALEDFMQSLSNSAASNISAPVDGMNWLMRKGGLPVSDMPFGGSDWMNKVGLTRPVQQNTASIMGETAGVVGPMLVAAKAPQIARAVLQAGENFAAPTALNKQAGALLFDPRFDSRVKEQERLANLTTKVAERQMQPAPSIYLPDYEGRPFITSMADRTRAGGLLEEINGKKLNRPVDLRGGQDFMFDNNPGMVWASANGPVKQLLEHAQTAKSVTGQNPLYIPWRMAPSGGDFANMTGEAMLSYADASMKKGVKGKMDKNIKQFIPDWVGVSDPASVEQFRGATDKTRKAIKNMLDTEYRNSGGLGIGEARLAVADPKQLTGADGGIMNIGEIFADSPMVKVSGHPAYPRGVPGQGLGVVDRPHNITELLTRFSQDRGIPNPASPRQTDLRALQMKPYAGLLDDRLLKSLGY